MEREGSLLVRILSDWASIHKRAGALSRVGGGCITVMFYSEICCSDFDSSGDFFVVENNYAKRTKTKTPTNIMKCTKKI